VHGLAAPPGGPAPTPGSELPLHLPGIDKAVFLEDIEPQDAALKRIWSGKAAEVLSRDFGSFQYDCAGARAMRAEGEAPGVSWWYLFSEELLGVPNDRSILFWTVDGSKRNWNFARRLTLKECETLIRLIANRDMNH
jgi:hypothetical protein